MYVDVCAGMRIDMCRNMCIDMCIHMCIRHVYTHVYAHEYTHEYRYVYIHDIIGGNEGTMSAANPIPPQDLAHNYASHI